MPIGPGLPYALGWYSQSYRGRRVVWHYGQLTGYGSSLIVKLPALGANLVVLSNSSVLPDACHLESGDITKSALGRSFLAAVVDDLPLELDAAPNTLSSITETPFPQAKPALVPQARVPQQVLPRRRPAAGRTVARRRARGTPPAHAGF